MKNFFKCFAVYLTAVMVLFGTVLFPAVGASAAESDWHIIDTFDSGSYLDPNGDGIEGGDYIGTLYFAELYVGFDSDDVSFFVEPGTFVFYGTPLVGQDPVAAQVLVLNSDGNITNYSFGEEVYVSANSTVVVQSLDLISSYVRVEEKQAGLYYQAFDMFANFIYGEGVDLTAEQNMVMTILATIAVLFVVVVPFLVVYFVIRLIFGR